MSDELVLEEPFRALWRGKDAFDEVEKITGNTVRALESRRTLRFEVDGQGYYLKLHHGTEIIEVVKSLIRLRLPVLGADREWNAIHRLAENGVDTMEGVAYGERGGNPLTKTSFIITKDLAPIINLRDYIIRQKPSVRIMRMIVRRLADMVRKMHACGINHRDCYILHFLMRTPFDGTEENLKLFIIDLHRAQLRDSVPTRWRNKDLIALLFSVRDLPFTQRDIFRFMKRYFQMSLRDIFKQESWLIESAAGKVARIERHHMKSIHGRQ